MKRTKYYQVRQVVYCTGKGESATVKLQGDDVDQLINGLDRYVQREARARDYTGIIVASVSRVDVIHYRDGSDIREGHIGYISYELNHGMLVSCTAELPVAEVL